MIVIVEPMMDLMPFFWEDLNNLYAEKRLSRSVTPNAGISISMQASISASLLMILLPKNIQYLHLSEQMRD